MTRITPERVKALIDAYGGDPARWPDDEREASLALVAEDGDLARAADEAGALDLTLDAVPAPAPSPALRASLKEIPETGSSLLTWITDSLGIWRPVAGLATAAVLGIVLGITVPDLPLPGPSVETAEPADTQPDTLGLIAAETIGIATDHLMQ